MTTYTLKQCRPDKEETAYFWKLFHAAARVESRWGSDLPDIAEELSYCPDLSREQKMFLLRAWQVLVDDKGGFGRFMGAFETYVYNMQDPADDCVAYKPELLEQLAAGELLDVLLEAYVEAQARIAELEARTLSVKLPDPSSKAFWSGSGKNETFYPSTYKIWVKESIERAGVIAQVAVKVE